MTDSELKIKDALQLLTFIKEIEPEYSPEQPHSSITQMIALRKCITALGRPEISKEERQKIMEEYDNKYKDF